MTRKTPNGPAPSLGRRLTWFIGLWCAGVLAVGITGYGIRLVLMP